MAGPPSRRVVAPAKASFYDFTANDFTANDFTAKASFYDFTAKDIDGNLTKLDVFRGKVVLVVNLASAVRGGCWV